MEPIVISEAPAVPDQGGAARQAADVIRFIAAHGTVLMTSLGAEDGGPVTHTMQGGIPLVWAPKSVYHALLHADSRLGPKLIEEDPAEGPPSVRLTRAGLATHIRSWMLRASAAGAIYTSDQAIRSMGAEQAAALFAHKLDEIALEYAAEVRP